MGLHGRGRNCLKLGNTMGVILEDTLKEKREGSSFLDGARKEPNMELGRNLGLKRDLYQCKGTVK